MTHSHSSVAPGVDPAGRNQANASVTVVVPTFGEVSNIPGLVMRLTAVREAVDDKDWASAQKHAEVVEHCLAQMNQVVNDAINGLSGM